VTTSVGYGKPLAIMGGIWFHEMCGKVSVILLDFVPH
jgi:hypothetical protein